MKYPQLVSARAVNAISDWLVSRLEQLGVDAPHIYSRLLLSLLQSSVQINDPFEFNNLETFLANRKGNSRRYPCDTNTLKKLNAVQCLKEIVSSDREITEIEALVDELLIKLIDIESKVNGVDDDDHLQVATLSITTTSSDIKLRQPNHLHHYTKHQKEVEVDVISNSKDCAGSNRSKSDISSSLNTKTEHTIDKSDVELDPKKRYFRAFPALTKDMEESFRNLRRNAKSLTWPVDKLKISSSKTACTNSIELHPQKHNKNKISEQSAIVSNDINDSRSVTTNGVKRKTKRRRNQALSKGTYQNIRKNSGVTGVRSNSRYRSSSPFWDTDFEGCWEMGRDLIKEFMMKQKYQNNRNRSTTDSAPYRHLSKQPNFDDQSMTNENLEIKITVDNMDSTPLNPINIAFCCNNISSPQIDIHNHKSLNSTRRLYKRDNSIENIQNNELEYAQFEAKFDSNLEALWNKNENLGNEIVNGGIGNYSMPPFMQISSLSTVEPFKKNLQNFWINYYNHHFDVAKISQGSHPTLLNEDDGDHEDLRTRVCNTSECYSLPSNFAKDKRKCYEYLNGVCERDTPVNVFLQNTIWSDIRVKDTKEDFCVQDTNENFCITGTDEDFYKKIWSSNNFDVLNGKKDKSGDSSFDNYFQLHQYNKWKWSEGINVGPNANMVDQSQRHLLHVNNNLGSSSSSLVSPNLTEQSKPGNDAIININSVQEKRKNVIDCSDSSITSESTTSCSSYSHSTSYKWQTPLRGDNLEPDIQSWSSSNPISLTEMYSNDTTLNDGKLVHNTIYISPELNDEKSIVTLPNHSPTTSGFVEYARIKASVKVLKHDTDKHIVLQQQQRTKELYSDDENLLTSERTHFHPIKTYADGHSFDICSSLEVVDYERSQSGYLYLESEKYLEYSPKDCFLNEEEQATTFGTPLYATSNCDSHICGKVDHQCDFVIKFRLRNCEVACQTDDEAIKFDPPETFIEEHPLCVIFSSSLRGIKLHTTGLASNDAIEALNKAVDAASKAASSTRKSVDNKWLPMIAGYRSITWSMDNSKVDGGLGNRINSDVPNNENCCLYNKSNNSLEQWSMREIDMKCELKGHDNNTKMHTLWGMCAACNKDLKSVPANRLLKDELQQEADEIMSDLKNMQDLYIGDYATVDSDSDWEIGETDNVVQISANVKSKKQGCSSTHKNVNNDQKERVEHLVGNMFESNLDTEDVFHKVNRLIIDLLCRESGKAPVTDVVINTDGRLNHKIKSTQFNNNIWDCNIENNISDQPNACLKPFDFLKRINDSKNTSFPLEVDKFLSHLNWEHSNLAKIWDKNTPPVTQSAAYTETHCSNENFISGALKKKYELHNTDDSIIVSRNFKNMNDTPTILSKPTISSSILFNEEIKPTTIKNVEQFFNSKNCISNTKFKISNRKRRHSASQNLFHTSDYGTANNNIIQITDFNNFNTKSISSERPIAEIESQHFLDSPICQSILENENNYEYKIYTNSEEDNTKQSKQTIITCKYWTSLNPTLSPKTENLVEGTKFTCLLDKNASILKHVTMMTRPLTR